MQLFYAQNISSGLADLDEQESRHCIRVLRLKKGSIIHMTDGSGNLYEAMVVDENPRKCQVKIQNVTSEYGKRNYHLHIAIAPVKNLNRFEWFLEKATEIGIDEITPIICDHSERIAISTSRMQKIIISALKQSLKAYLPILNEPVPFSKFISSSKKSPKFIACYHENNKHLKNLYKQGNDAVIIIGPEGDFSEDELKGAIDNGYQPVNLGESRLRTETAALVSCMVVNIINAR